MADFRGFGRQRNKSSKRRLTESETAHICPLTEAARVLPRTADELSANIAALRDDIQTLHAWLQPLHQELSDLDTRITELQTMLKRLPGI